jgi:uncharacterized alkaline shock family protein YloU
MNIDKQTPYGGIDISQEAIASVVGKAVCDCYGVAGLASKASLRDVASEILKTKDYVKGIYCKKAKQGYEIDVYLYVYYGVKIPEILSEVQKKVKYVLQQTFEIKPHKVNVYVQDIKEID